MKRLVVDHGAWLFISIFLLLGFSSGTLQAQSLAVTLHSASAAYELEVIALVNAERIASGLAPLRQNSQLTAAARLHNQDMIAHEFFSHTGSDGSSPSERACAAGYAPYGWGRCYVGENIGAGYTTPGAVVTGWMNSAGHRANILNPDYREIGLGYSAGGPYSHYWTMALGAQPNVLPVFIENDSGETTARQVTLTLTAETVSSWGSLGAISEVQLSEDPLFAAAVRRAWAPTVTFELSGGNGLKTIFVKLSDGVNEVVSSDSIVLNEPVSTLSIEPNQVAFTAVRATRQIVPEVIVVQVDNYGVGALEWAASSSANWVSLSQDCGSTPATILVSIDPGEDIFNQPAGVITLGAIVIAAAGAEAQDTSQNIPVTLQVVDQLHEVHIPLIIN